MGEEHPFAQYVRILGRGKTVGRSLTEQEAEAAMEGVGLTCNKNAVPYDPEKPTVTSGVRLGTPAATSRGFGQAEFKRVGELIIEVLRGLAERPGVQGETEADVRSRVRELCRRFPIYTNS